MGLFVGGGGCTSVNDVVQYDAGYFRSCTKQLEQWIDINV